MRNLRGVEHMLEGIVAERPRESEGCRSLEMTMRTSARCETLPRHGAEKTLMREVDMSNSYPFASQAFFEPLLRKLRCAATLYCSWRTALYLLGLSVATLQPALAWSAPAAQQISERVAELGRQAKAKFAGLLDPLPIFIDRSGQVRRELGAAARDVVRREHNEAIDALVRLSASPADGVEAEAALRQLVRSGRADLADVLLVRQLEQLRGSPPGTELVKAVRHTVALRELPSALWIRMNPHGRPTALIDGSSPYTMMWGARALPAVRHWIALDPADPLPRLMLLWLTQASAGQSEARTATTVIEASGDARAATAVRQHNAWALSRAGLRQNADRVMLTAVQRTQQALDNREPGFGSRETSLALVQLGALRSAMGDMYGARAPLERALALREELAAAAPDDLWVQLDLAAAHEALAALPDGAEHGAQVGEIRRRAEFPYRYTPMLGPRMWAVMISYAFAASALLALVAALMLLVLYRHRVAHWMRRAAVHAAPYSTLPASTTQATIELRMIEPGGNGTVRDLRFVPSLTQCAAGAAFALTAVLTYVGVTRESPSLVALIFRSLCWLLPLVIVQWLIWTGSRRHRWWTLGAYFGALALISAAVAQRTPAIEIQGFRIPGFVQPSLSWAMQSAPMLLLLLFLNRKVRSIGPSLLVMALVICAGGMVAYVMSTSAAGAALAIAVLPGDLFLQGSRIAFVVGALAFTPLALVALALLGAADRRKWVNDQSIVFDTIWMLSALYFCQMMAHEDGPGFWKGLLPFIAYKIVSLAAGFIARRAARLRPPRRLLLLRVFGDRGRRDRRRTEALFDQLTARWAWLGPIQTCAAPDLAASTIGPTKFLDFITGRLGRRFVIEHGDVERRLAAVDPRPDIDGRYRVNELFCGSDTWQALMRGLMRANDRVLMDLRGFDETRLGSRYELGVLLDEVPAERIVLLVDGSTDRALLGQVIADHAQALHSQSPNAAGERTIMLLESSGNDAKTVADMVRLAEPS
jgi:hypothetical protein